MFTSPANLFKTWKETKNKARSHVCIDVKKKYYINYPKEILVHFYVSTNKLPIKNGWGWSVATHHPAPLPPRIRGTGEACT